MWAAGTLVMHLRTILCTYRACTGCNLLGACMLCSFNHGKPLPFYACRGKNYEIRTAFPQRAYADLTETLRDAGLVPNATLFLRAV